MKIDLKEKKILVTGASGSLGSQILFVLHNMGVKPIAHVRESSNTTYIDSIGLEKRVLDLRRRDKMAELMDGVDLVIHTAAYVNFRQDRLTQFTGANVIGAVDLFNAASKTGVQRFLHVSTVAAVGAIKRKENLSDLEGLYSNEKTQFNLDHLHIPYIMTKRAAEVELYKEAKDSKTELVVVNPSIILAPSQTESDRERALRLFGKFIFPEIPIRINMVDLRDVAPGVVSALTMGENGERYILGGDNICVKEFALAVSSELGKIPHLVRIPRKFYDVTSRLNEMASKILGKSNLIYYPDNVRMLDYDWAFSSMKAHDAFGYKWRSLHNSISDFVNGDMIGTYLKPEA